MCRLMVYSFRPTLFAMKVFVLSLFSILLDQRCDRYALAPTEYEPIMRTKTAFMALSGNLSRGLLGGGTMFRILAPPHTVSFEAGL